MTPGYQPLILIGAARSGTKLLRDLIAEHPSFDRVPYDINYIWRLGNEVIPHDELTPDALTVENRARLLRRISDFHTGAPLLIEKTVSNSLRIPFVNAVFPDALFVHLVRNGYDVVESAYRQWQASPDWRYIFKKARAFPIVDAPSYAINYALSTLRRMFSNQQGSTITWGPRYDGIDVDVARLDTLEVCAIQWTKCVTHATQQLAGISAERVLTVRYEGFVMEPLDHLNRIGDFLNIDPDPYKTIVRDKAISTDNIGKGKRVLTQKQLGRTEPWLEKGLTELNYA